MKPKDQNTLSKQERKMIYDFFIHTKKNNIRDVADLFGITEATVHGVLDKCFHSPPKNNGFIILYSKMNGKL